MGPAEGGHDVAALHALGSRPHPLVGTRDVVDQLERPEEATEDLVHRGELGQFAGAGCRQRLVGEDQSLLDAIGHDKQPTKDLPAPRTRCRIAEPASDRDRLAEQGLAHVRVRFGEGLDDQHPAILGSILAGFFLEDGAGACGPSAADGPVAEDVPGDPGGGARRPTGSHGLALATVGGTGALVVRRSGGVLALEVQRLGKAFERLARLDLGEGELERMASARGVAVTQGRQAFFDQGRAHDLMMARRAGRSSDSAEQHRSPAWYPPSRCPRPQRRFELPPLDIYRSITPAARHGAGARGPDHRTGRRQ
jgi:hypothetical protein